MKININKTDEKNHLKFKKGWSKVKDAILLLASVSIDDSVRTATLHTLQVGELFINEINDVARKKALQEEIKETQLRIAKNNAEIEEKKIIINKIKILNPLIQLSITQMLGMDLEEIKSLYDEEVIEKENRIKEEKEAEEKRKNELIQKERDNNLMNEKKNLVFQLLKKKSINTEFTTEGLMGMDMDKLEELKNRKK
jgi:hypothetical protein